MIRKAFITTIMLAVSIVSSVCAGEAKEGEGTIINLWPLVDYRESPGEGYSNLSILGPLIKYQHRGDDCDIAVRPFYFGTENDREGTAVADYIYPIASSTTSPEASRLQVLEMYQKDTFRRDEGEKKEKGTTAFPFYISGESKKYGPYTAYVPFYGDLYGRFWRDEIHFVMFPFYGRTVKKGTTTRNYLYPIFSTVSGDKESGFQVWPLYGSAAREGVYDRRFILLPFFMKERSGLDTENPTEKLYLLPFYAATDSPQSSAHYYPWPFFGFKKDKEGNQEERDYFWPFWRTIRGEKRNLDSYLPFYSLDRGKENSKRWIMWPLFKHEEMDSSVFHEERNKILHFLYADVRQSWPKVPGERYRAALWPIYSYRLNERGIKSFSMPAPLESIVDREGVEKNWAPLWRIYQQKWNDSGDSAVSLLWNLYWHEKRGHDMACEFYPFVAYRSERKQSDISLIKGLIRFSNDDGKKGLTFFWLPFGFHWGDRAEAAPEMAARSKP